MNSIGAIEDLFVKWSSKDKKQREIIQGPMAYDLSYGSG